MISLKQRLVPWLGVALVAASTEWSVSAQSRVFSIGGTNATLEDVSVEVQVLFRALRFNEVSEQWNVDVTLTNAGSRRFAPTVVVSIESILNATGPLQTNGVAGNPPKPFLLFGQGFYNGQNFLPGTATAPRTIAMGYVEGAGAPKLDTKVFALSLDTNQTSFALGITRSLNGAGQPLTGVSVFEVGPAGARTLTTDPAYGVVTLGQGPGAYAWRFELANYLPVWRKETLTVSNVLVVANPRLVRRSTNSVVVGSSGGQVQDSLGRVQIVVPAGVLIQPTNVTLTVIDGQTLPGLLPLGWSPLRAFWFECDGPLSQPASASLRPPEAIAAADKTALVRWDETRAEWEVKQIVTGNGTNAVTGSLAQGGAFAWVVGDRGTLAPPAPQVGQALRGSTALAPAANSLTATGVVNPANSPASRSAEEVTGTAALTIGSSNAPLSSGLLLRCDVGEDYQLQDGSKRFTPQYENFVVGYQRPGDADERTLQGEFPMRPLLLLGSEELAEAKVRADVLVPTAFTGGVFESAGNSIEIDGIRITSHRDDFSNRQAALISALALTNFQSLVNGSGFSIAAAFDLTVAVVASGHSLSLQVTNLPANRLFVLARILSDAGLAGLEPVERLQNDTNGLLSTLEPTAIEHLPGLTQAGQYLLLEAPAPQGLVSGITRNSSGQPVAGLPVRVTGQPWVTLSKPDGSYQLLAPTGAVQVSVTDLATGNSDFVDLVVSNPAQPTSGNLTTVARGPRVVSITPADGAIKVPRVTPIIMTFSEPVNPATLLGNGLQLLGSNGVPVVASLSLNLRNTVATLLAREQLNPSTLHTIVLSTNIADFTGLKLEGQTTFTFTTESDVLDRAAAQLIIYEPTNGLAAVFGTPGTAEPESPVLLVNDTSGETATILSRVDGSFTNFVTADVEDFISAVLVNRNGTRTTLPASRQIFRDGSVGLYRGGGTLEAQSDNGPVQVIVEPGAIQTKTKLNVSFVPVNDFLALVEGQQPIGGKLLGGLQYQESGNALRDGADVVFPVDAAALGLPPGIEATNGAFALVVPHKYDGVVVYELIDTMSFEPTAVGKGRLVTHSPPFPGLLARRLASIQETAERLDALSQVHVSSTDPTKIGVAVGAGVIALDMPKSDGVKIAGQVQSGPLDAGVIAANALKPVAGALVVVDEVLAERPASFVRPGELLATSDQNGSFALVLRPSVQNIGRELRASHPRFPFQIARAPVSPPAANTGVVRANLLFAEGAGSISVAQGSAPPVISVSYSPLLPPASSDLRDAATVVVIYSDDVQVSTPTLEVVEITDENGRVLNNNIVTKAADGQPNGTTARATQKFKVGCPVIARVKLEAKVADNEGKFAKAELLLHFGLSSSTPPPQPGSIGPHVTLAWPPKLAQNIPSFTPLLVRFSSPLLAADLDPARWEQWVTFDAKHRLKSVTASPDRREISVLYDGDPNGDVKMTILSQLHGENNSPFDQDPTTTEADPFDLSFTQSGQRSAVLDDGVRGSGVVIQGNFAYALDNQGDKGSLIAYNLSDPLNPDKIKTRALDGRPATLTLIPGYRLPKYVVDGQNQVQAQGCEEEANLLAVFFGGVNDSKRLLVLPATGTFTGSPIRPVSSVLTENPASQIVKSKWDPPFLGYLEFAEANSITLLNLPAFYVGASLRETNPTVLERLPSAGDPGLDQDGNGEYCEAGNRAPLPFLNSLHPVGFSFSFAPNNPKEQIQDFDFLSGLGLVGVVSRFIDGSQPDNFRMVLAATTTNSLSDAVVRFDSGLRARRLTMLPAARFTTTNGTLVLDLAIVSLTRDAGGDGLLALVDIRNPAKPVLVTNGPPFLALPAGEGLPGSIVTRADGLLALATSKSVLLLDPTKLLLPGSTLANGTVTHPAFIGNANLAAGGVRDFASAPSGISAVFSGDNRMLVQAEPRFQVVTFDRDPFQPEDLLLLPERARRQNLGRAKQVEVVELAATDTNRNVVPDLARERHNYVLIDAPGSAGGGDGLLPLVVAAVNEKGQLYVKGARTSVPAVLGDKSVQNALFVKQLLRLIPALNSALGTGDEVGEEIGSLELMVSLFRSEKAKKVLPQLQELAHLWVTYPLDFKARRMSDDPASPLYNKFLAGPFLVLPTSPEDSLLQPLLLQAQQRLQGRRYLRASPRLWVGFPENFDGNRVLGQFASQFKLNPRLTVQGVSVPLISGLGERLLNFLVGSSDILGPAALAALEFLAQEFIPVVGQFIKTDFDPTLLPGANLLRLVAFKDRPLIFVGGFGASRLNDNEGEFWPDLVRLRSDPTALSVAPNGSTFVPTVPVDTLRHVIELGPFHIANIYGSVLKFLRNDLGYVEYDYFHPTVDGDPLKQIQFERRRFRGKPILTQDPIPDLFVFAYDWRLDNAKAAALLKEYIDLVKFYHPDADGVDLIAHSNGNMVSRRFVVDNPGVVKRYISVGAPWLGSGKGFAGMLTGDMEDVTLNFAAPIHDLRQAVQFMPGFHQLLVNKGMFDLGLNPVVEVGFDVNRNGKAYESYDYGTYADAIENHLFRNVHAEVFFRGPSPSRKNHEDFHQPNASPPLPIANWSQDHQAMESHHIVGMQSVPRSLAGVRLVGRLHESTNVNNVTLDLPALESTDFEDGVDLNLNVGDADGSLGITTNQFRFRADFEFIKTLGDGTVPILSLARGWHSGLGLGLDYNAPDAKLYCVVSQAAARDDEAGHNPMLNNPVVFDWLQRILEGRRVKQLEVTATSPPVIGEGSQFEIVVDRQLSDAPSGEVTTLIDFGDGGSAARVTALGASARARYSYRQNGTYVISAGSTTTNDITGFISRRIQVTNIPPTVTIDGGDVSVGLVETRVFTAQVRDPGLDDTHTFVWRLDGQTLGGQNSFAAVVNFPVPGQHTLSVEATDSDGGVGTNKIQVQVSPTSLPTPASLPVALRIDGMRKFGGQQLVFSRQPKAFIRITGHKPGAFDSKGISVRERNNFTYNFETFVLPLSPFLQRFVGELRLIQRAAGQLIDAIVQRTSDETSTLELFQSLDNEGGAPLDSLIEFRTRGGPLEVELLYSEGGTPIQFTSWTTNTPADVAAKLRFEWQSTEGTPLFEPTLKLGGDTIEKKAELLGPKAADRLPPAVAAIYNPATGNVTIQTRDNVTPPEKIELFLVQDVSGDGRLEDEVFYKLKTNVLVHARLPSRKFAIVARDEIGNVSALEDFQIHRATDYTLGNRGTGGYCEALQRIQNTVSNVIQQALVTEAVHDLFLLRNSDLWIFEQGSGACLWRADPCLECNGNFLPGISDDDFQLFLPTHLQRNYQLTTTDRAEFLASGIHDAPTLDGDWYFKPPVGLDGAGNPTTDLSAVQTWQYTLPAGFSTPLGETLLVLPKLAQFPDNLADGFPLPLTPATVIARTFAKIATATPELVESTFFPVRRENFMFGAFDLELPPAGIGVDPVGDGGAGRQMLLLKWALEGSFVNVATSLGVNINIPSMDDVYGNLKQTGVPLVEGYEWGIFQEFAALDGKVAQNLQATYGPATSPQPLNSAAGNDLEKDQRKKLKKMGKTAIRAALGRLAGDPETASLLFDVDRRSYQTRHLPSFEDYILAAITNSPGVATAVFGDFGLDRPVTEGPSLSAFLKAKKGQDDSFFDEILKDPAGYERFVRGGLLFLRELVQKPTRTNYFRYLDSLISQGQISELAFRNTNTKLILEGDGQHRKGLNQLRERPAVITNFFSVSANNYTTLDFTNITFVVADVDPSLNPKGLSGDGLGDDRTEEQQTIASPGEYGAAPITATVTMTVPTIPGGGAPESANEQVDNQLNVIASVVDAKAGPEILQPELRVFFDNFSTSLSDYPAQNSRRRAPRYLLKRTNNLDILVEAVAGLGPLTATITNVSRGLSFTVQLTDPSNQGFYINRDSSSQVQLTDNPSESQKLYIKDEDLVQFLVPVSPGTEILKYEVMMDLAEIATGGLSFTNRQLGELPRPSVLTNFTDTHGFFKAGDQAFDDTIRGNGNLGEKFVEQFGSKLGNNGEADFLYVLSHGYPDGTLHNHNAPLGGGFWFDPTGFRIQLDFTQFWTADADVLMLHACFVLNTTTDFTTAPTFVQNALTARGFNLLNVSPAGGLAWRAVMQGLNRPIRMILAFDNITGQNAARDFATFTELADRGTALPEAWSLANAGRPWSFLCFQNNLGSTLRELGPPPLKTDAIILSSAATGFPDVPADDQVGLEPERTSPQSRAAIRPLAAIPEFVPSSIQLRMITPERAKGWVAVRQATATTWLAQVPPVPVAHSADRSALFAAAMRLLRERLAPSVEMRADAVWPIHSQLLLPDKITDVGQTGCSVILQQTIDDLPVADSEITALLRSSERSFLKARAYELVQSEPEQRVISEFAARAIIVESQHRTPQSAMLKWMKANQCDKTASPQLYWPVWTFQFDNDQHPPDLRARAAHVHATAGNFLTLNP